jgi:hypothetical protein
MPMIVPVDDCAPIDGITACEPGEIFASADLGDVRIDLTTSVQIVCDLLRAGPSPRCHSV